MHVSVCPSVCPSVRESVRLSVCPSVCPSVRLCPSLPSPPLAQHPFSAASTPPSLWHHHTLPLCSRRSQLAGLSSCLVSVCLKHQGLNLGLRALPLSCRCSHQSRQLWKALLPSSFSIFLPCTTRRHLQLNIHFCPLGPFQGLQHLLSL